MPITGKDKLDVKGAEPKVFDPIPRGVYQFQLLDISLKEEKKYQSEEMEEKLNFKFVCIEQGEQYGQFIWRSVSQKLTKFKGGSNLYLVLTGLLNRQLTDDEVEGAKEFLNPTFLNNLIGTQTLLAIGQVESEKTSRIYNTIESFLPIKAKLPEYNEALKPKAKAATPVNEPDFSAKAEEAAAPVTMPAGPALGELPKIG